MNYVLIQPLHICPRWLSWTDVQVRFSSLLLAMEYEDCANQTFCTDMSLEAALLPVTNLSTIWSWKVATLALTNSLGCGFGNSTRSWGLLSHCDCTSLNAPPSSLQGFLRDISWAQALDNLSITGLSSIFGISKKWVHVCDLSTRHHPCTVERVSSDLSDRSHAYLMIFVFYWVISASVNVYVVISYVVFLWQSFCKPFF